ncbi:MAG: hypothetical protein H0X11_12680 [Betaproteobacteria bacterium]|nr:hypothetical protein [Betaproteobacteria bacterium]
MWFLQQLEPAGAFYNISKALRLRGELDPGALKRSFQEIANRHKSLRTAVVENGEQAVQTILPAVELPLPVVDLRALPAAGRELEIRRIGKAEAGQLFDLSRAPLLRLKLARVGDAEHVLYLTMHHIIGDGWSLGVVYRELAAIYRAYCAGLASPLSELPIQRRFRGMAAQRAGWRRIG